MFEQRQVEQPDDAPQDPAADEIDGQREEDLQQYPDRLGEEVAAMNGLEIQMVAILWTVSAKWAFCTLSGSISGAGVSVPKKRGHINRE